MQGVAKLLWDLTFDLTWKFVNFQVILAVDTNMGRRNTNTSMECTHPWERFIEFYFENGLKYKYIKSVLVSNMVFIQAKNTWRRCFWPERTQESWLNLFATNFIFWFFFPLKIKQTWMNPSIISSASNPLASRRSSLQLSISRMAGNTTLDRLLQDTHTIHSLIHI